MTDDRQAREGNQIIVTLVCFLQTKHSQVSFLLFMQKSEMRQGRTELHKRENQRVPRLMALLPGGIILIILANQLIGAFSNSAIGLENRVPDYPEESHSSNTNSQGATNIENQNEDKSDDSVIISATDLLLKKHQLPPHQEETAEIQFVPGSLEMNSTQVLQHCYTDPVVYKKHFFTRETRPVMSSDQHHLIYIMLPKSGSSTARFMLKKFFQAREKPLRISELRNTTGNAGYDGFHFFSFVREPLSRFYSSYDEVFMRLAPWAQKSDFVHPYPFLYDGLSSGPDYKDTYCPKDVWDATHECKENGTLALRMERFVNEYSGLDPFDIHLQLQVPLLTMEDTGRPYPNIELYNLTHVQAGWEFLAFRAGVSLTEDADDSANKKASEQKTGTVEHRRSASRRADISRLSNTTKQRICEMALLDYCCLNIPLPPPCHNLHCKLSKHIRDAGNEEWTVQPWSFPKGNVVDSE